VKHKKVAAHHCIADICSSIGSGFEPRNTNFSAAYLLVASGLVVSVEQDGIVVPQMFCSVEYFCWKRLTNTSTYKQHLITKCCWDEARSAMTRRFVLSTYRQLNKYMEMKKGSWEEGGMGMKGGRKEKVKRKWKDGIKKGKIKGKVVSVLN
jgi:hypothetical protein